MAAVTEHEWTDKQETSVWAQASVERVYDREYSRDAADLARFGKRQQLKVRRFTWFCSLKLS
jgi:hypothetical protein